MAQITYNQLQESVRNKAPLPFGSTGTGFSTATVTIPSIEPYFIQIDGFKPQELTTAANRSEQQVYDLLSIDKSTNTNAFKGRQILINSSRIVLNSYDNYTMMFSKEGFVFSSKGTFNVDTDEEVTLFGNEGVYLGVPNKGQPYETTPKPITEATTATPTEADITTPKPVTEGTGNITNPVTVNNTNEIQTPTAPTYQDVVKAELSNKLNERDVATPDRDYEPLVLGNKLADWLSDLILAIQTLQINTPSGPGYISAGESQYNLKKLVARIPEIVSTYGFIDGRSHLQVDDPGPAPPPDPNDNLVTQVGVSGITTTDNFEDPGDLERLPNTVGVTTNDGTKPTDFIIVDGQPLLEPAALAFIAMKKAAREEAGLTISVVSGFRPAFGSNLSGTTNKGKTVTITTQETIRRDKSRWKGRNKPKYKNDEDFIFNAPSSDYNPQTAPPGASNHGNGIALDLNTGTKDKNTLNAAIYTWLCKNSYRFGFVRAVRTEEWHFEYVGTQQATGPYVKVSASDANRFYTALGLDNLA